MSESLGDKQRRFAKRFAELVLWAYDQGLGISYGEALRSDEQAEINAMGPDGRARLVSFLAPHFPTLARLIANNVGSGIRPTLHEMKLAHDFNLFAQNADGSWRWLDKGTEPEWMLVGKKWESMGADHCWGGRFRRGDANHVSILHEGLK